MTQPKKILKIGVLISLAILILGALPGAAAAEEYTSAEHGITMQMPTGWVEKPPMEGIAGLLVIFADPQTGTNLNIVARTTDAGSSVESVDLEKLFFPIGKDVVVEKEELTTIDGIKFLSLMYHLKGEAKKQFAGDLELKFLLYYCYKDDKEIAFTFTGLADKFDPELPKFQQCMKSLKFTK